MSKKIVIVNGYTYNGGPIALSVMCRELRKLGYDASLLMVPCFPTKAEDNALFTHGLFSFQWKSIIKMHLCRIFRNFKFIQHLRYDLFRYIPVRGCRYKMWPFINFNKAIVVYPEIVFGNPFNAPNVVRWLLFYNRYKDQPNAYGASDLFIAYREIFNDTDLNPSSKIVKFAFFDSRLYRQYNFGVRKGNCYILRKGKNRADLPSHFDGPVFNNDMSQEELVKIFNERKYCYSYDTQTYYTTLAAVCGCIPIVVMEEGKTVHDYRAPTDTPHYGVAYGDSPEQIDYAIKTRAKLLESLNYDHLNEGNAKKLVHIIEERFGPIKRL